MTTIDDTTRQTAATRSRYNRIAPMHDAMEAFTERAALKRVTPPSSGQPIPSRPLGQIQTTS